MYTDRPDPPKNVRLLECVKNAKIEWEPGNENNEEVIEYIVYYNTSFDEPNTYKKAVSADRGATTARMALSPWANYTFHVRARNSLGISDPSAFTSGQCRTQPHIPYRNPDNVCSDSKEPDELVITWDVSRSRCNALLRKPVVIGWFSVEAMYSYNSLWAPPAMP